MAFSIISSVLRRGKSKKAKRRGKKVRQRTRYIHSSPALFQSNETKSYEDLISSKNVSKGEFFDVDEISLYEQLYSGSAKSRGEKETIQQEIASAQEDLSKKYTQEYHKAKDNEQAQAFFHDFLSNVSQGSQSTQQIGDFTDQLKRDELSPDPGVHVPYAEREEWIKDTISFFRAKFSLLQPEDGAIMDEQNQVEHTAEREEKWARSMEWARNYPDSARRRKRENEIRELEGKGPLPQFKFVHDDTLPANKLAENYIKAYDLKDSDFKAMSITKDDVVRLFQSEKDRQARLEAGPSDAEYARYLRTLTFTNPSIIEQPPCSAMTLLAVYEEQPYDRVSFVADTLLGNPIPDNALHYTPPTRQEIDDLMTGDPEIIHRFQRRRIGPGDPDNPAKAAMLSHTNIPGRQALVDKLVTYRTIWNQIKMEESDMEKLLLLRKVEMEFPSVKSQADAILLLEQDPKIREYRDQMMEMLNRKDIVADPDFDISNVDVEDKYMFTEFLKKYPSHRAMFSKETLERLNTTPEEFMRTISSQTAKHPKLPSEEEMKDLATLKEKKKNAGFEDSKVKVLAPSYVPPQLEKYQRETSMKLLLAIVRERTSLKLEPETHEQQGLVPTTKEISQFSDKALASWTKIVEKQYRTQEEKESLWTDVFILIDKQETFVRARQNGGNIPFSKEVYDLVDRMIEKTRSIPLKEQVHFNKAMDTFAHLRENDPAPEDQHFKQVMATLVEHLKETHKAGGDLVPHTDGRFYEHTLKKFRRYEKDTGKDPWWFRQETDTERYLSKRVQEMESDLFVELPNVTFADSTESIQTIDPEIYSSQLAKSLGLDVNKANGVLNALDAYKHFAFTNGSDPEILSIEGERTSFLREYNTSGPQLNQRYGELCERWFELGDQALTKYGLFARVLSEISALSKQSSSDEYSAICQSKAIDFAQRVLKMASTKSPPDLKSFAHILSNLGSNAVDRFYPSVQAVEAQMKQLEHEISEARNEWHIKSSLPIELASAEEKKKHHSGVLEKANSLLESFPLGAKEEEEMKSKVEKSESSIKANAPKLVSALSSSNCSPDAISNTIKTFVERESSDVLDSSEESAQLYFKKQSLRDLIDDLSGKQQGNYFSESDHSTLLGAARGRSSISNDESVSRSIVELSNSLDDFSHEDLLHLLPDSKEMDLNSLRSLAKDPDVLHNTSITNPPGVSSVGVDIAPIAKEVLELENALTEEALSKLSEKERLSKAATLIEGFELEYSDPAMFDSNKGRKSFFNILASRSYRKMAAKEMSSESKDLFDPASPFSDQQFKFDVTEVDPLAMQIIQEHITSLRKEGRRSMAEQVKAAVLETPDSDEIVIGTLRDELQNLVDKAERYWLVQHGKYVLIKNGKYQGDLKKAEQERFRARVAVAEVKGLCCKKIDSSVSTFGLMKHKYMQMEKEGKAAAERAELKELDDRDIEHQEKFMEDLKKKADESGNYITYHGERLRLHKENREERRIAMKRYNRFIAKTDKRLQVYMRGDRIYYRDHEAAAKALNEIGNYATIESAKVLEKEDTPVLALPHYEIYYDFLVDNKRDFTNFEDKKMIEYLFGYDVGGEYTTGDMKNQLYHNPIALHAYNQTVDPKLQLTLKDDGEIYYKDGKAAASSLQKDPRYKHLLNDLPSMNLYDIETSVRKRCSPPEEVPRGSSSLINGYFTRILSALQFEQKDGTLVCIGLRQDGDELMELTEDEKSFYTMRKLAKNLKPALLKGCNLSKVLSHLFGFFRPTPINLRSVSQHLEENVLKPFERGTTEELADIETVRTAYSVLKQLYTEESNAYKHQQEISSSKEETDNLILSKYHLLRVENRLNNLEENPAGAQSCNSLFSLESYRLYPSKSSLRSQVSKPYDVQLGELKEHLKYILTSIKDLVRDYGGRMQSAIQDNDQATKLLDELKESIWNISLQKQPFSRSVHAEVHRIVKLIFSGNPLPKCEDIVWGDYKKMGDVFTSSDKSFVETNQRKIDDLTKKYEERQEFLSRSNKLPNQEDFKKAKKLGLDLSDQDHLSEYIGLCQEESREIMEQIEASQKRLVYREKEISVPGLFQNTASSAQKRKLILMLTTRGIMELAEQVDEKGNLPDNTKIPKEYLSAYDRWMNLKPLREQERRLEAAISFINVSIDSLHKEKVRIADLESNGVSPLSLNELVQREMKKKGFTAIEDSPDDLVDDVLYMNDINTDTKLQELKSMEDNYFEHTEFDNPVLESDGSKKAKVFEDFQMIKEATEIPSLKHKLSRLEAEGETTLERHEIEEIYTLTNLEKTRESAEQSLLHTAMHPEGGDPFKAMDDKEYSERTKMCLDVLDQLTKGTADLNDPSFQRKYNSITDPTNRIPGGYLQYTSRLPKDIIDRRTAALEHDLAFLRDRMTRAEEEQAKGLSGGPGSFQGDLVQDYLDHSQFKHEIHWDEARMEIEHDSFYKETKEEMKKSRDEAPFGKARQDILDFANQIKN